jgi:asparagine synthetase B (glutamine-hydrolysing)
MCGVVAYQPFSDEQIGVIDSRRAFMQSLMHESRVRGRHAAGIYQPVLGVRRFIGGSSCNEVATSFDPTLPAIAHTRYSTSGDWEEEANNQPIQVGNTYLVFNGVIHMGTREEFSAHYEVECETYNDGEVFLRLAARGWPWSELLDHRLQGTSFAGCWFDWYGQLWAGRNARRPLWRAFYLGAYWYASTRDIFVRAGLPHVLGPAEVPVGVERVTC